jgi:hypothetical protein
LRLFARDGFSCRGVFPWRDIDRRVALQLHRFGFDAVGEMAGAAFVVGDAGFFQKIVADGVAPDDGVASLIFETCENVVEALRVNVALQRFPLVDEFGDFGGAFIVGVVNILDDGFLGVELVRVGNVMEEEQ